MLSSFQIGIIRLIVAALKNEKKVLPADFDFEEAYKLSNACQITPLIYYGALNCGGFGSPELENKFFLKTCQHISYNTNQLYQISVIEREFKQNNIDYMLLKGSKLKKMYPKPEMRVMSDSDILIKPNQYDKIKTIMQKCGFVEKYESDHELVWKKEGVLNLELHKRLIPTYNIDYYRYFGDGWTRAVRTDGSEFSLSDEDELIYIFTHFSKHYRRGGIGIKHLVDLYVYLTCKPNLDQQYIKTELSKLQLFTFYENILRVVNAWFEDTEFDAKSEFITNTIFNSGSYGEISEKKIANALADSKFEDSIGKSLFKRKMNLIFPPLKFMKKKYTVLNKMPFLLPFMWSHRIIYSLVFKRKTIADVNNETKKLTVEQISDYQKSLNYVGLDFNFKE